MSTNWNLVSLNDLGVLRFRGADAVRFLQGQVSNDVERLTVERSQLAGYHNPQGRVIALLRLVQLAPDDVAAVLPRELVANVAARLAKFVLRAKVKIADDTAAWRVEGLVAPYEVSADGALGRVAAGSRVDDKSDDSAESGGATEDDRAATAAAFEARSKSWAVMQFEQARVAALTEGELSLAAAQLEEAESIVPLPTASASMLPDVVHAQSLSDGAVVVRVGATPARWLVLSPAEAPAPLTGCVAADRDVWRLLDITDGDAQVYAATSEEFVAQMLNLDALDAIAFAKGCYTGQEVIARAHYRGRVKRRLQRFVSRGAATLAVGDAGTLGDGRGFKVVEAVKLADGRCEFLAVAPVAASVAEGAEGASRAGTTDTIGGAGMSGPGPRSDGGVGAGSAAGGASATAIAAGDPTQTTRPAPVVDAEVLTLPYPLPE